MKSSSLVQENRHLKVKSLLEDLIDGLFLYKEEAWSRITKGKKIDPLTKKKYELSNELWANLKEIHDELTEDNVDAALEAIKFHYTHAFTTHEKILNDMLRYYLLGNFFKNLGYYWGNLGKRIDEGSSLVKKEISTSITATTNTKNLTENDPYKKAALLLDDLIIGLFSYKEITQAKLSESKIADPLTSQKHKLSSELWEKLSTFRNKLTPQNIDKTLAAVKLLYINAHTQHEKILNDILSTSYSKYLPQSISHFLNTYFGSFFNYLGSFWSGNLGKEISKVAVESLQKPAPVDQKIEPPKL